MKEKKEGRAFDIFLEALALYDDERYAESAELFEQALELGEPQGALFLGLIAELGFVSPPDNDTAIRYYRTGADMGFVRCLYNLAVLNGHMGNYDVALTLLQEASEKGFVLATALLGFVYKDGPYELRNQELAAVYLKRASDEGQSIAMAGYAKLVCKRDGTIRSLPLALSTFYRTIFVAQESKSSDDKIDDLLSGEPKTISRHWLNMSTKSRDQCAL